MPDYTRRRTMMVDTQVRPADVTKFPIIDAMLRIPRERFVPEDRMEAAYLGDNLRLGPNRVMLEPRTLAKMLDAINLQNTDLVLDLGCGYGYASAVMAEISEAVVAVEDDANLAAEAQSRLAELGVDNVAVIAGELMEAGAQFGPFDAIVVEGAVEIVPESLLTQLKEGGRIIANFAEGELGIVRIARKFDGNAAWRFAFNATAPLLPGFERPAEFAL